MKTSQYVLIICFVLSVIANFLLLFSLGAYVVMTESEYSQDSFGWCELNNDYASFSNDLLLELQYYDSDYERVPSFEMADCWVILEGD